MEYRQTHEEGYTHNKETAMQVADTISEKNRFNNIILACLDSAGEESFRLIHLKTVLEQDMYDYFNYHRIKNREITGIFTALYKKGIRWIIPILDTRELDEESATSLEGIMAHWILDACADSGLFPSDIIYIRFDDSETTAESEREGDMIFDSEDYSILPSWDSISDLIS